MNHLVTLAEVFVTVVLPLLVFYLRGTWPSRMMMVCMSTIPVLWYFVYAPIHELSHLLAACLVGGQITDVKLIPRFWAGEVAVAWIKTEGITSPWSQVTMSIAPYVFDVVSIAVGLSVLRPLRIRQAFLAGFLFMLLCLRPAFDLVCETEGFLTGFRGDLFNIALIVGYPATWAFLAVSLAFAFYVIFAVIIRFKGAPHDGSPMQA